MSPEVQEAVYHGVAINVASSVAYMGIPMFFLLGVYFLACAGSAWRWNGTYDKDGEPKDGRWERKSDKVRAWCLVASGVFYVACAACNGAYAELERTQKLLRAATYDAACQAARRSKEPKS